MLLIAGFFKEHFGASGKTKHCGAALIRLHPTFINLLRRETQERNFSLACVWQGV